MDNSQQRRMLPGGGPQRVYLGGLIFIVRYNGAFPRPPVPRNIVVPASKSQSKSVKFIDDGTVAVSINLKSYLQLIWTFFWTHRTIIDPFIVKGVH